MRIAKTAAGRTLQREALAGLHLVAAGGARVVFLGRAEPHHETAAPTRAAAGHALRRKARLVEAADDGGGTQELVVAPQAQAAAPLPGAAGIRHEVEAR